MIPVDGAAGKRIYDLAGATLIMERYRYFVKLYVHTESNS